VPRRAGVGLRLLPAGGGVAAPPGGPLSGRRAPPVPLPRAPHGPGPVPSAVAGPASPRPVGTVDAAAVRRRGLDYIPADGDAWHPQRMKGRESMNPNRRPLPWWLLPSALCLLPSVLRADGGTLRLLERAGNYQVAVFTSPTPLRAGPVDVSVLVQDAATGECLPQAHVTVRLKAAVTGRNLEYPATTEGTTNRLFRAACFDLPEPGWWDMEVAVA